MPRLNSIDSIRMPNDDFAEVQRKLEAVTLELKTVNDPGRRRTLLREMSRLVAEAERISSQPPKMINKLGRLPGKSYPKNYCVLCGYTIQSSV
jgi:hypothetical protein